MSSLFAFPGQGAQQAGMLHRLPAGARPLLEAASDVLGEQVLELDSEQALQSTRAVQLCLLLAGVAWAGELIQRSPAPDYVAGLSIGAYPAAVVAEALDFTDAVRLVALRGELMQRAYPQGYGMTALNGLDLGCVEQLLAEVGGEVFVANLNSENQIVIAGADAAMAEVAARARHRGQGMARRLAVSVPSHCRLLDGPAAELAAAFASVTVRRPRITYLSGSSARPIFDPQRLRDDLAGNMARVVDWRATLRNAYERGVRLHLEMPPGSVLSGLARPVFEQGRCLALEMTLPDTVDALLRQEVSRRQ
ncbi:MULTISPECIES: malonate decarboxylase subunit epsilon [unclassified Pseudomonas]|uniref:malonate decarboxylase subunit epsilon n=1 Tax=unclassified Pseudomonas TaxID=196821 RepID=UPI0021BA9781|nr:MULTISPECIES: malonate decarboxylase subunit epsilon [unclassified Pseudomonas]MCT8165246.1 malonate decarboxylase subunit epsilon [Pseudomonas sp. HD6422]MCT8184087.1 malonate decarboxylase subunit epsilon [Pseudomonas sp. HD6421]